MDFVIMFNIGSLIVTAYYTQVRCLAIRKLNMGYMGTLYTILIIFCKSKTYKN